MLLPLIIAGIGIVFSIIAMNFVKIRKETDDPQKALNIGNFGAIILTAAASFFVIRWMFPTTFSIGDVVYPSINIFWAIVA